MLRGTPGFVPNRTLSQAGSPDGNISIGGGLLAIASDPTQGDFDLLIVEHPGPNVNDWGGPKAEIPTGTQSQKRQKNARFFALSRCPPVASQADREAVTGSDLNSSAGRIGVTTGSVFLIRSGMNRR